MTGMASTNCVFFWHHEVAFLELTPNGPRLCLRSFGCCLGALTFDVDPCGPRRMSILRMQDTVPKPHRRLQAITEDDQWISRGKSAWFGRQVSKCEKLPLHFLKGAVRPEFARLVSLRSLGHGPS